MLDYKTRLFRSLVETLNSIKVQIDVIAESTKKTDESQHLPTRLNAELQLPPAMVSYYLSKQRAKPRRKVPEWLKFVVSVLTLFAVAWYACITHKQLGAMLDANINSKTALSLAQRAYLSVGDVEEIPSGIKIHITNFGHVPAKIIGGSLAYVRFAYPRLLRWSNVQRP